MNYQVVIDPKLGVNLEDIVAAWNDDPRTADVAEAEIMDRRATSFGPSIDPVWIEYGVQGAILLVGFVGGITVEAVHDLLKEKIMARLDQFMTRPSEPEMVWEKSDGGYLFVVKPQADVAKE